MKKIISKIFTGGAGIILGMICCNRMRKKQIIEKTDYGKKMSEYYHLLNQWLTIRQEGHNLAEYFKEQGYETIAIYGMKELGERLYEELKETDIKVQFGIDKSITQTVCDLEIVNISNIPEEVDVIVVTATYYYGEIVAELAKIVDCPTVSLEDVVYYF